MPVRFDFTVSDVDADNIFGAISDAAYAMDMVIIETTIDPNLSDRVKTEYISAARARKEYLLGLTAKMTNTRA